MDVRPAQGHRRLTAVVLLGFGDHRWWPVFLGNNNGTFVALDAKTGKELWSFQTGAGVNAPATVFEGKDGKQRVAVVAGGNSLAGTTHGDNLWVFSLDGTVEQEPGLEGSAEAVAHAGEESADGAAESDSETKEESADEQ